MTTGITPRFGIGGTTAVRTAVAGHGATIARTAHRRAPPCRSSTATRPRTAIAGWAAGAAFKARAHGVRGNVMGWIRLAPSDRRAPQAGLDCSETASPPLSQTLWPFHKPQRLRAVAPARHCCDPAAPDRVLLNRGARVLPASSTSGTGSQHEHQPRQRDAGRQNVLASTHGGAVDAAPTRHHQSKPVAMVPAVRWCPGETGFESNRSSGQLVEGCGQILHQMKELLKTHQLDRLRHP